MMSADPEGPRSQRADGRFDPALEATRNELGGVVYGAAIQAGEIGSLHFHQPVLALPQPNQLPPPVRLTGRGSDAAAMDAARESLLILLTGPPGVGKTALAVNWGHAVRGDFPDGALFADLHGYAPDGPAPTAEVLGRFLRALGVDPRQVPSDLADLTDLYRSIMSDKRVLVVLDDALTAAQVIPLLPTSPESMAVVTSRVRLGGLAARGAQVIQVGRLDADAAVELLSRIVGDSRALAAPHAVRELVELCGGLPLAVCVAGARLAGRPRWPVSEMVEAMALERERLAALTMEDNLPVRSTLDLSYQALPEAAARMYRLMSLLPGRHFDSGVGAAAGAVPRAEAKRLLGVLTDANLLDDATGGQYRFHDLTRLHARELADQRDSPEVRDEAIRRMLDWFLTAATHASLLLTPYRASADLAFDIRYPPAEPLRFASSATALEWLDRELLNVLAAARLAAASREPTAAWQLAEAMWPVFLYRGRHTERLEFDALGLAAARAAADALGEAKMLYRLGTAVLEEGRFDEAEAYIAQALAAWRRLGQPDRVAGSLRRLGYVAMARRRPADAVEWFARALAAYRELSDSRHVAVTLSNLGDAYIETGRPRDAVAALEEAGSLLADFPDPHSQGRVLTRLGRAHGQAGDFEAAARYLDEAVRTMRMIGSARGEADALLAAGQLAARAGRKDEARARYAEAQRVLISLGSLEAAEAGERLAQLDRPGPLPSAPPSS